MNLINGLGARGYSIRGIHLPNSPFNTIRSGLFGCWPGPRGGSEAQTPKVKININLEMKLCVSHYIHKSIADAKFEADSSFSFGDMTSQNFPQKKGTSHQIRLFTLEKRI